MSLNEPLPIFTVAQARPMERTTSAIGPFCRAKMCSTAERTADLAALARRLRAGIGRPLGFLRRMRDTGYCGTDLVSAAEPGGKGAVRSRSEAG